MEAPPKSDANAANSSGGTDADPPLFSHRHNHHPRVLDHYSLPTPSSAVKFRSTHVHVYDSQGSQLIVEERVASTNNTTATSNRKAVVGMNATEDDATLDENIVTTADRWEQQTNTATSNITVKRVINSSPELLFLRGLYSAIAFFMGAFVFIFAVGLMLFLISDIANQAREIIVYDMSDDEDIVFPLIGTILAIPVFLHGLTQVMTLVTSFVADVFAGSPLLHSFGWGIVLTNWVKFIFFIGIPATTLVVTALSGSQEFFSLTLVTTFVSVTILFAVFSVNVIRFRVSSCLYLVKELYERQHDMSLAEQLKYTILTAMQSILAGKMHNNYIYKSNVYDLKRLDSNSMANDDGSNKTPYLYSSHGQWYIKFTQLMPRRLFVTLDAPMRCWTLAEIGFNTIPFYTRSSWSLESVFCRAKRESHIAVLSGPSGVTLTQTYSSLVCYFFGVVFYILLVAGLFVFVQAPSTAISIIVGLFIAYWLWQGIKEFRMNKHASKMIQTGGSDGSEVDSALFQKWETFTVTKPTPGFAWISFAVENIICVVTPFSYLCYSRNLIGAILYIVLFLLCFEKNYFDIGPIVEALGSFGSLGLESAASHQYDGLLGASTREEWQQKSRLYHITRMNNSASRRIWFKLLKSVAFIFAVVALAAISSGSGAEEGAVPYTTFPSNNTFFYDVPQEKVSPICNADLGNSHDSNGTSSLTTPVKYLADFGFLSIIPYFKIDSIQSLLDTWFGEGQAFLDEDVIATFRELHPDLSSSASFQLVTFSDKSAVVCVRGTTTYFDFLGDARLWYAPALFQLVQGAMPFGSAFNALVHLCVNMLAVLETANLKKVSYYVETTAFVNYLRKSEKYTDIKITGHSLGGGLALITGAQTQTMAVGVSAPNTVMGRSSVTPEISLDDLEQYTYNLIPQRDIVGQLGGKAKFASIKCRAGINEPFGCHYAYRSLCELMYTCGNVKRPVYCECVDVLGYPEPTAIDGSGTSFQSTCEGL
ncbi:hypothetical protein ACHAWF_007839 [Thalassiosira exigua]